MLWTRLRGPSTLTWSSAQDGTNMGIYHCIWANTVRISHKINEVISKGDLSLFSQSLVSYQDSFAQGSAGSVSLSLAVKSAVIQQRVSPCCVLKIISEIVKLLVAASC